MEELRSRNFGGWGSKCGDVGQPIQAADPHSCGPSRLKAGCGQDCPPYHRCQFSDETGHSIVGQLGKLRAGCVPAQLAGCQPAASCQPAPPEKKLSTPS